jgi:hypothetical protein
VRRSEEREPYPGHPHGRLYLVTIEVTVPVYAENDRKAEDVATRALVDLAAVEDMEAAGGVIEVQRVKDREDLRHFAESIPWSQWQESGEQPRTCERVWDEEPNVR